MSSVTIIEYPNFKDFADTNENVRFFHKELPHYRINRYIYIYTPADMQVKIVSDPLSSFPVSLHCPFSLSPLFSFFSYHVTSKS
jgi:hypothetical protein